MPRIAVFDSGLGSLSIVRQLRRVGRAEIIYYADLESFPYGTKSRAQLEYVVRGTIKGLLHRFSPDLVVVASNTPSLVLEIDGPCVMGVQPPLGEACRLSSTGRIGILGTKAAVKSRGLSRLIRQYTTDGYRIFRLDASELVALVESGVFLQDHELCREAIGRVLTPVVRRHNIDVVTLSSTHLPFLLPLLRIEHPDIHFVDPALSVAQEAFARCSLDVGDRTRRGLVKNTLRVYASGNYSTLQENLLQLGVRRVVRPLDLSSFLT